MSDEPRGEEPGLEEELEEEGDERLEETRLLLASVEELRALLAPLSPDDRERVLALARELKDPIDQ